MLEEKSANNSRQSRNLLKWNEREMKEITFSLSGE
jgi:hypothetical protein